jgi:hypothetical protein
MYESARPFYTMTVTNDSSVIYDLFQDDTISGKYSDGYNFIGIDRNKSWISATTAYDIYTTTWGADTSFGSGSTNLFNATYSVYQSKRFLAAYNDCINLFLRKTGSEGSIQFSALIYVIIAMRT